MKCTIGTFEEQWELDLPESLAYPILYVCPHCYQPWGMMCVPGSWVFIARPVPCLDCGSQPGDRQCIPGSFIWSRPGGSGIDNLYQYMPPELLLRELNLHIQAVETQTDECSDTDDSSELLTNLLARGEPAAGSQHPS